MRTKLLWTVGVVAVLVGAALALTALAGAAPRAPAGLAKTESAARQAGHSLAPLTSPLTVRSRAGHSSQKPHARRPGTVLYDQYDNDLGNGIVSANRTDDSTLSAEAGDNFVVPGGETWNVTEVDVRAPAGFGVPTSFAVNFYTDSSGLPGALVYSSSGLAVTGDPDYTITLTTPAVLTSGTYWVSVVGTISGANWYWEGRSVTSNTDTTAWRNPGDGYGTGCTDWARLSTCIGISWPDQMFRLVGTSSGGGGAADYSMELGAASLTPGANFVTGSNCDDCTVSISTPFPVSMFGTTYTSFNASSNGNLQFTTNSAQLTNVCLPASTLGVVALAYWDDLDARAGGMGIYTDVTGTAPNRIFYVEYRTQYFPITGTANFEVVFSEATGQISFVYGTMTSDTSGTIGMQGSGTGPRREYSCNTAGNVPSGRRVDYNPSPDYANDLERGQSIVPGTDDTGNHCDDCTTTISLPFPFTFFGNSYTSANVSSNGNLQFDTANSFFFNSALPAADFGASLFPFWDDLYTADSGGGQGIFTSTSGSAPDRIFNIEWRAQYCCNDGAPVVNFEAQLSETTNAIAFVYGSILDDSGSTV